MSIVEISGIAASVLIISLSVYFTVGCRFLQFKAPYMELKEKKPKKISSTNGYSPFKAFATCISGTVGVGNIVGVSAAVTVGGSGALFWIWISALFSMILKYSEIVLSIKHRKTADSEKNVGAVAYLRKAFSSAVPSKIYAVLFAVAMLTMGDMVQSNAISYHITRISGVSVVVPAVAAAAAILLMCVGKSRKCIDFLSVSAPLMCVLFLLGGIVLIVKNGHAFLNELYSVFSNAFSIKAAAGAGLFTAMRKGCVNGLFSNESGLGSAAFAHGASNTSSPEREGMLGFAEVAVDTLIISSVTGFSVLITGRSDVYEAFGKEFGTVGKCFVVISVLLFAVSSMLSSAYYGKCCMNSLFPGLKNLYILLFVVCAFAGAVIPTNIVWTAAEFVNFALLIINSAALFMLRKEIFPKTNKSENFIRQC